MTVFPSLTYFSWLPWLPAMQETPVRFLGQEDLMERDRLPIPVFWGFPGGSAGKESTCNAGDLGLIPGLGRYPGEEKGYPYPLQYSGLKHSGTIWEKQFINGENIEHENVFNIPISLLQTLFYTNKFMTPYLCLVDTLWSKTQPTNQANNWNSSGYSK